jgi:hypothetical protein
MVAGLMMTGRHTGQGRQRVALLVLLALLMNLASPALAMARMAEAEFLAGAICHSGSTSQDQPAQPAESKACPICALFAAQPVALPQLGNVVTLPQPRMAVLPPARAPPALTPRAAPPSLYPARGPPRLA